MDRRFRLVLIGAGQIGAQAHLPAALACDKLDLVAIVDPLRERAEQLVRSYGLAIPVFGEVAPALKNADGVVLATPNETHLAVAAQCLELDVPVLIEKPLTATYEQALRLQDIVLNTRAQVMVGYVTRYRPNVQLLKRLLESDHFGKVTRFAYQYGTVGGWAPLSGYGGSRKGGGVLAVTGSHFLDRMIMFWGYPTSSEYWDDGEAGPEANAFAAFVFQNGLTGTVRCSKTAQLPGALVLDTEEGHVVLLDNDTASICLRPKRAAHIEYSINGTDHRANVTDCFAEQLRDFVGVCRGSRSAIGCDLMHGIESIRLIDELYSKKQPLASDWYAMK